MSGNLMRKSKENFRYHRVDLGDENSCFVDEESCMDRELGKRTSNTGRSRKKRYGYIFAAVTVLLTLAGLVAVIVYTVKLFSTNNMVANVKNSLLLSFFKNALEEFIPIPSVSNNTYDTVTDNFLLSEDDEDIIPLMNAMRNNVNVDNGARVTGLDDTSEYKSVITARPSKTHGMTLNNDDYWRDLESDFDEYKDYTAGNKFYAEEDTELQVFEEEDSKEIESKKDIDVEGNATIEEKIKIKTSQKTPNSVTPMSHTSDNEEVHEDTSYEESKVKEKMKVIEENAETMSSVGADDINLMDVTNKMEEDDGEKNTVETVDTHLPSYFDNFAISVKKQYFDNSAIFISVASSIIILTTIFFIMCVLWRARKRRVAKKRHFSRLINDLNASEKFTLVAPSDEESD